MLILVGTLKWAGQVGGQTNKKTGEVIPVRNVISIEEARDDGRPALIELTVPDLAPYESKLGKDVQIPVRAYVPGGGQVAFFPRAQ